MSTNINKQDLLKKLQDSLQEYFVQLENASNVSDISKIKNRGLDLINLYFSYIKDLDNQDKKDYGQSVNKQKQAFLIQVEQRLESLKQKEFEEQDKKLHFDISEPLSKNDFTSMPYFLQPLKITGFQHPIMKEIEIMNQIWQDLGFKVFEGRELDLDDYVFEKLNIPKGHPAREMWDTFYTQEGYVPTTQTSNMQIRMMRYFKKPPVKGAVYGKVFRNEELDAVHSHTFFQYEIVYVDKGIKLSNLIAVLVEFLKQYYNKKNVEYRIMPAHFPFVEPGFEMHLKKDNGWLEILGAGMIHPRVLQAGDIDSNKYTGFAAGFGIDRMVMLKYNLKDLRDLYQGNLTMYL